MKRHFIQLIVLLCLSIVSYAQTNGSFEDVTNTSNNGFAFSNGYVRGWTQSHGTPSLQNGAPNQGNYSAWMWSYSGRGEGIVQDYAFRSGKKYTIKFWVKTNNPDGEFFVQAANNVPKGTYTASAMPVVNSKQTIFTDGLNYTDWREISVEFTPNNDYAQLWVYPYLKNYPSNGQAELTIDGIRIEENGCTWVPLSLANHSFENVQGSVKKAFSNKHVSHWMQSHGTPDIRAGAPGQGNRAAWMWAYDNNSEGIITNVKFEAGKNYRIKFWVQTNQSDGSFYLKAANGILAGTSTLPVVPIAASAQNIIVDELKYTNWTEKTVIFTANADYNQLWVYPQLNDAPSSGLAKLSIDAISVEEEKCCESVAVEMNNQNFETVTNTSNNGFAFSYGYVPGWKPSHGTPSLMGGAPGQGRYSGWMWSYNGRGEGLVTAAELKAGVTYQMKIWVRTNNPDGDFYIKAANGVPNSSSNAIPAVASQQTIFTDGLNYQSWTEKTITFTANANYTQLWIYPQLNAYPYNGQAELTVDNIRIAAVCENIVVEDVVVASADDHVTKRPIDGFTSFKANGNGFDAQVYPNPSADVISIDLPLNTEQAQVKVYSLATGQQVGNFTVTPTNKSWAIPDHVTRGLYQVVVIDPNRKKQKSIKLMIHRK